MLPTKECCKPATAPLTVLRERPDARMYEFDACLPGSTTQSQLEDTCGVDELVEAALDGCVCVVTSCMWHDTLENERCKGSVCA